MPVEWEDKVAAVRAARDAQIPEALRLSNVPGYTPPKPGSNVMPIFESCGLLTPVELDITSVEHDATHVLAQLASRKWSAVQVTSAFCKRAAIAQQLVNCLVDYFPEEALARAKELDDYMAREGKPIGPLHGLPFSIKGHMNVKGHDVGAGLGVVSWIGQRVAKEHAYILKIIEDAGAIFFCRTTLPEAIMHLETNSPCWGHTLNPFNTALTPGGSSGGESALVACGGSPFGLGGDIGGSLRVPASHCGLYTIRMTTFRPPKTGGTNLTPGSEVISASNGTMARSLRDVDLFSKVIFSAQPWLVEPSLIPIPWTPLESTTVPKKLRVGIMMDDGVVRPTAPMLRALSMAKTKLSGRSDIELVDFKPLDHAKGIDIVFEGYFTDGGANIKNAVNASGAPLAHLTDWALSHPAVKDHTIHELWDLCIRRDAFRMRYQKHWMDSNIDVLLCPPFPGPAPPLDTSKYWGYSAIWNLLDYPGSVFPTNLKVDAALDKDFEQSLDYRSETEAWVHNSYSDKAQFEHMPLCLQVIGPRFTDEKVMKATELLDKILAA